MRKLKLRLKKDNNGSAILTVLIVILFLSVLATTLLYLSGRNFVMKQNERKTIASFYGTETAIEEIRAGLVMMASESYKEAYSKTLTQYAWTVDNKDARRQYFLQAYMDALTNNWSLRVNAAGGAGHEADALKAFVSDPDIYNASKYTVIVTVGLDTSRITSSIADFKGVSVQYKNDKGFVSKISTDFAITVPDMEGTSEINAADFVKYVNWIKE